MFAEIRSALRPAIVMLAMFTLLLGIAYPLVITGVAQLVLPAQAGGSLISGGGHVTGSARIGQSFTQDRYAHGARQRRVPAMMPRLLPPATSHRTPKTWRIVSAAMWRAFAHLD